jgi:serine/threonine protein kinase
MPSMKSGSSLLSGNTHSFPLIYAYSHPNVTVYKESFIDEVSSTLCLVMEYADGGDILSKVNEH